MKWYKKHFENFYIRVLWIIKASSLRFKVGCPPACTEGHTYRWPCKERISNLPGAKKPIKKHWRDW